MLNVETNARGNRKTLLAACLLAFLQTACTYTPVYDSGNMPQVNPPVASEQADAQNRDNAAKEGTQMETNGQPVRVAVVSPETIQQRPTSSNKDIAAARLRTQAADAVAAGQAAKAEGLLNRALRISPRSAETYHQLATIKLEQGASGQALQLARKGLSLCDPDSKLAMHLQALVSQASLD
ncbi:MAG: hypothetical protein AB8B48_07210 [Pseudomonadales bacterium]